MDDLRTLSLADAGELSLNPQPVAPQKLLQEVAAIYRYQIQKKDVTLDMDIESQLPDLTIDPARMTQILTNILDNALRHSLVGGHTLLSPKQAQEKIEISIR